MDFLPPLKMTYGEDFAGAMIWAENGERVNFTGWTGTWTIERYGSVKLSGALTLSAIGGIAFAIPAASVNTMVPILPSRSFTLIGTVWSATLTNGTRNIYLKSAVQLVRNKTTIAPYSSSLPGWII